MITSPAHDRGCAGRYRRPRVGMLQRGQEAVVEVLDCVEPHERHEVLAPGRRWYSDPLYPCHERVTKRPLEEKRYAAYGAGWQR